MEFDYKLALMCGTDIPFSSAQLTIHQPTLKEISMIGEKNFFQGVQTLGLYKSMFQLGESNLDDVSNFQIFMMIMNEKEMLEKKQAVYSILSLLFPEYKVNFTPSSILFTKNETTFVDENNFEDFQEIIRSMFCLSSNSQMDQMVFNPANDQAREIAKKIEEGRRRVAEIKGLDNVSVFSQYISILTIGVSSMSLNDIINLTIYQIYDLIERYSLWQAWDIDLRVKLAGSTDKKQVENWMKNIH